MHRLPVVKPMVEQFAIAERLTNLSDINLKMTRDAVVIGDVLYGPGGTCGPRIQHDFQLVVIHEGSLELLLDGEMVFVMQGQAILLSPSTYVHLMFSRDRRTHHSWCAVNPSVIPQAIQKELIKCKYPGPFAGRLTSLLDIGKGAAVAPIINNPLQDGLYLGLGIALLCEFAGGVQAGEGLSRSADVVLARMEHFIRNECARPVSLCQMARVLGLSRQHLLKLCRMHGRPTPMEQLYAARLDLAADLLRNTGLPIKAVAERCGFVNVFHFSRRYKEAYGASPSYWRQKQWRTKQLSPITSSPK